LSEDEPIFTPSDFVCYISESRKVPLDAIRVPERLVMTYQRDAYEYGRELIGGRPLDWWIYGERQPFCVGKFGDTQIGLGLFWIGAPAAVMTLEELIACGVRIIFEVGMAGGLQSFLKPGDILVVTKAVRDEGTSYHYLPPEIRVESSERLREKLIRHLKQKNIRRFVGPVWSTDGVYRETRAKFRKFRDRGVSAVNMETSAIFSLAKYRAVEAASAQVISDILEETGWLQAFEHESVQMNMKKLLEAVITILSEV